LAIIVGRIETEANPARRSIASYKEFPMNPLDDVETRVRKIVSEILEIPLQNIRIEHLFVEDLDAESIQSVELMAAFEEEFGIEMDEEKAMAVKTVGAAVDYIRQCLQEQRG
jgi:acyl carrier protein